jgi:putative ABC transport system permease protein
MLARIKQLISPYIIDFSLFAEALQSASSSIRSNKIRSFLTALAIIIGTAAVIAIIGLGSSASKSLDEKIDDLGGRTLYVGPSQRKRGAVTQGLNPLVLKDAAALNKDLEHNWKISPTMTGSRQVKFNTANISGRIGGYLPIHFNVRGYDLGVGRLFNEEDNLARRKVVVVGSKVPQELKTRPNLLLGKQITIAGVSYEVIGILKEEGSTGWQSPDEELYVPILTAAQRIFGRIRVDSINVGIANDANIEQVMMSIERILRQQHDIGPGQDNDFRIADYSQFSDLRRDATSIFTFLIAGIAAISLLVGGIGVMNIMLVSVTERTREIGLRKALGASKSVIMLQFIVEAILLCGIGGIIGVLIGTSLLALLTSIFSWPFEMPLTAIVGSISFSALVGLFFGIWPANKAAKLDPVIALRHE